VIVSTVTSTADCAHRPRRLDEVRVVDAMAGGFAPDRGPPRRLDRVVVRTPRSRPRRSVTSAANKQLRIWPSAVNRVRSHVEQKACDTEAMTPNFPPGLVGRRMAGAGQNQLSLSAFDG